MKINNKTQELTSQIEVNNKRFTTIGEVDEPKRPAHESFNTDYTVKNGGFKKKGKPKK